MKDLYCPVESIINSGIICWYKFSANSKILCIEDKDSIYNYLKQKGLNVLCKDIKGAADSSFILDNKNSFDYVIAIDSNNYSYSSGPILNIFKGFLKKNGILLLGCDNYWGLCYLCGDRCKGQLLSQIELKNQLKNSGFHNIKLYSVLPKLFAAQFVISENITPVEDFKMRYFPLYNNPETIFEYEENLYKQIISNGLFHKMANSYLMECTNGAGNNKINQVDYVTLSTDRGVDDAFATIVYSNKQVKKKALFAEGQNKLLKIKNNLAILSKNGIKVVPCRIEKDSLKMPYIDAPLGNVYLKELFYRNQEKFIETIDYYVGIIRQAINNLKTCFFDLVPLNAFYVDNDFVFFDQEFSVPINEDFNADLIIWRSLIIVYSDMREMNSILPIKFFWERYGIQDKVDKLCKTSRDFLLTLRNQQALESFNNKHKRNNNIVCYNQQAHQRSSFFDSILEKDCFEGSKNIYIWGSGKYANWFLSLYKNYFNILGVIDNDQQKWGQDICGIKVSAPEKLFENHNDDFRVIICVKDYKPIYLQLLDFKIKKDSISIFEKNRIYAGWQNMLYGNVQKTNKPYHIGYLSGVFDLYHIGHINMFRRAKEQCDYLIVGVTSDEFVMKKKNKTPFIPCEERIAVIQSCKYVDKVVKIPFHHEEVTEAWEKYQYDVQFCGSDCEHNNWWRAQKTWLETKGSTIVFFPYTQQTSSTKIQALIEKKLI